MSLSKSLQQLAVLSDRLETSETELRELKTKNKDLLAGGDLEANMTVEIPFAAEVGRLDGVELALSDATLTNSGTVIIELNARFTRALNDGPTEPPDQQVQEDESAIETQGPTDAEDTNMQSSTVKRAPNLDTDEMSEATDGGTAVKAKIDSSDGSRWPTQSPTVEKSTTKQSTEKDGRADTVSRSSQTAADPAGGDETANYAGGNESGGGVSGSEADESAAPPAYRDPERLAAVYDSEKTFAEMTNELGVDVTPKTVRHYMVEYHIHEPDTFSSTDYEDEADLPAYKDPERLTVVYNPEKSFAEMTNELGVDVTPKTVRHYMVEHGIHDPDSSEESDSIQNSDIESDSDHNSDEEADSGVGEDSFLGETTKETPDEGEIAIAIADAVEMPDEPNLSQITEAVCTAKTLYEVQQELGIDRDSTRRLLSELNLLELVHGRVSTTSARSQSKEEVERRIREAVTDTAPMEE